MISLNSQAKEDTKLLWYELPDFCLLIGKDVTFLKLGDLYLCDLKSEKPYIRPPTEIMGQDFRIQDLRQYEYKTLDPKWIRLTFNKELTDGKIIDGSVTYPPVGQVVLVPMDESFFLCMIDSNHDIITFGFFKGEEPFKFIKPHEIRSPKTMLCVSLDIAMP